MAVTAPRKHSLGYRDVAYWQAHPEEAEREIERIRGALLRCDTSNLEIDRSIERVRKAMAGGTTEEDHHR